MQPLLSCHQLKIKTHMQLSNRFCPGCLARKQRQPVQRQEFPLGLWGSLQKTFPRGQRCETHHREHALRAKGPRFTASPTSHITARPLERSHAPYPYVTHQKEQLSERNIEGITASQRLRGKKTSAGTWARQPANRFPSTTSGTGGSDGRLHPGQRLCLPVKGPHRYSLWPVWCTGQQTFAKHGIFTLSHCLSVERLGKEDARGQEKGGQTWP